MDRFIIRTKIVKDNETAPPVAEPQPSCSGYTENSTPSPFQPSSSTFSNVNFESSDNEASEKETDELVGNSEENEERTVTGKKRKFYDVKYRQTWELEFKWLTRNNSGNSSCMICQKTLAGGKKHLQRHAASEIHIRKACKIRGAVKIATSLANTPTQKMNKQMKIVEMKLIMFAVEHNLPFLIFEHLLQFICSLPEREILKLVKCSRTKATSLVNDKVGPFAQTYMAKILKYIFFSIIIDETTDISAHKCLVIVVRYYNKKEEKVVDSFFGLVELESATADAIFNAIINVLKKYDIPITNIIGFASDNASVMMGHLNGVKAKFQEILPNIFVMGCLSHSLHLCASKACASLPNTVEDMARSVYNYFAHSAKRQHDFKEFQNFVEAEPHKILRSCQTRWLSLEAVVNRIVQQWDALTLYFQSESLEQNVYGAEEILNNLNNIQFKLYFLFLQHILKIICKMNLEFQSENPRIHILIPTMKMYFKMISKFYIKNEIINNIPIDNINPQNPDFFKKLEDICLGAGFETTLTANFHKLSTQELQKIRINCLNFSVQLCFEIRTRIDFKNDVLNHIANVLDLQNIFKDDKPSLSFLASKFPNIVPPDTLEDLNLEWRLLCEYKTDRVVLINVEELISFLTKQIDHSGETVFKNLLKLFQTIIALPHGSASAERIFSLLVMIKDKYRNRLHVSTVENLLHCKQFLKNNYCYTWVPTDELLNFK